MRFKFHKGTCRTRMGVVLAIAEFEIVAMNTSTIIIDEVHGHNHSTVCSSNSKPNIYSR